MGVTTHSNTLGLLVDLTRPAARSEKEEGPGAGGVGGTPGPSTTALRGTAEGNITPGSAVDTA